MEKLISALTNLESAYLADEKCKLILEQFIAYEQTIPEDEEVILTLSNAPLLVTSISYKNPDIIMFYGFCDGQKSSVIQHVSQLNFLMTSQKRECLEKPRNKIGFIHPHDER